MNEKKYVKPEIVVFELEANDILLSSGQPAVVQRSLYEGNVDIGSKSYNSFD